MQEPIDAIRLLSSTTMVAKKADSDAPETYVIDLAELRQIILGDAGGRPSSEIQK